MSNQEFDDALKNKKQIPDVVRIPAKREAEYELETVEQDIRKDKKVKKKKHNK